MSNTNETKTTKTQAELFSELKLAQDKLTAAELEVEAKMREMATTLGATFVHEGLCDQYPDAPILQIRCRHNKEKSREVPFFVPLKDFPALQKLAMAKAAEATSEAPTEEETMAPVEEVSEEEDVRILD